MILLGVNDTTATGFEAEYTENVSEIMASNAGAAVYCLGLLPLDSGHAFYARRATLTTRSSPPRQPPRARLT